MQQKFYALKDEIKWKIMFILRQSYFSPRHSYLLLYVPCHVHRRRLPSRSLSLLSRVLLDAERDEHSDVTIKDSAPQFTGYNNKTRRQALAPKWPKSHWASRFEDPLADSSPDYSRKVHKMVENSHDHITRVLFCGFSFPASQAYTREYLQSYPYIQVEDVALDDVPNVIDKYHLCVVKNCRIGADLIAKAAQMKLIMQFGVGLEGVNVDAATQHNIKVARIPGNATGNAASCAEMAVYLMLGLLRKQKEMEASIKRKDLGMPTGETLLGKTVFIMGFGAIGVDLAKRLRPFGVKIIATKRRWSLDSEHRNVSSAQDDEVDGLVDKKGGPENIYEFAGEADIVVPCLSLNAETAGIVDGNFLSYMRKGSLLVNVARGGILDYKFVLNHLQSGHLGGLAIDVAWTEPFDPDDPILKFPNVLITPHVAGVTEYSYRKMAKVVGDCALQLHSGQELTEVEVVN